MRSAIALSFSLLWVTSLDAVPPPRPIDPESDHLIQALLEETNFHRREVHRMAPVTIDPEMCIFAERHAKWMARTGQGHIHSGPATGRPQRYSEIIFLGPTNPRDAVAGWIRSPGHHAILVSRSTKCGFGYAYINGRWAWVGVFR